MEINIILYGPAADRLHMTFRSGGGEYYASMRLFLVSYRFLKPNEVIMKKIIFWLALIVGIVALIGSCAKKDDTTTTTTLSAPTGLTATGGASQVVLDWTAVSGATSYTVYWGSATGVSSSSTSITSVSTDSYTHTGLDYGTTYYYKVAAVDSAGTGMLSSEVNATTATSSSFTCTAVSSCSSTASGSFYVDNGTLSGIYDLYHIYAHLFTGFDNSTGCVSNSNFTSGKGPTGTQSLIIQNVFTSSTSFATKSVFYSDTACSSEISSMVTGYNEVSVGDNVTGLRTSVGISTYPSHASKVTYKESCSEMKGTTDVGTAYLNTLLSTSWVTTGQTHTCQGSGRTTYALWAYDNSSVFWERLHTETSSSAYPDNWSSDTDSTTKL